MPVILLIFAVGLMVFFFSLSKTENTSQTASTATNAKFTPPAAQFDQNNPNDIIKVIGLLAECVANKGDSSFYAVFENDNRTGDNRRIIINACIDGWDENFKNKKGSYRWCWISSESAAFLDTVPFTFDGDNVKYTYYTEINKPITYRNRGVAAVKEGIARANFANRHNIKLDESASSIDFFCD